MMKFILCKIKNQNTNLHKIKILNLHKNFMSDFYFYEIWIKIYVKMHKKFTQIGYLNWHFYPNSIFFENFYYISKIIEKSGFFKNALIFCKISYERVNILISTYTNKK